MTEGAWRLPGRVRVRLLPHALFWGLAWPVGAGLAASLDVADRHLYPFSLAVRLAAAGLAILLPQLVPAAALLTGATAILFGVPSGGPSSFWRRCCEPFVFAVLLGTAAAFRFPALLHHPFLWEFRPLPVAVSLGVLGAFAIALLVARSLEERGPGRRSMAALGPLCVAVGLSWLGGPRAPGEPRAPSNSVFLVGLDSVWVDDLPHGPLAALASEGGTCYRRVVAPALITNGVWASILLEEPVSRHGVILGLQDWSLAGRADSLPARARARGMRTRAIFPNRSTTWVGARGGFDEDEGGPLGWRQMATAWLKDAGIVLPLLLPVLPRVPFALTPRNQADTFTYSIEDELGRIFGAAGDRLFTAAHITYLHENRYPSFPELSPGERKRVLAAPVGRVFDNSFDWRNEDEPDAPVRLRAWKWAKLQRTIVDTLRSSGALDPTRGNFVAIFADHGPRYGLSQATFRQRRFWHVPLLTWGERVHLPPESPISLIEVGWLVGLEPADRKPPTPAVTFADVLIADWKAMEQGTRIRLDGTVDLPPHEVAVIAQRAETFAPSDGDFDDTAGCSSRGISAAGARVPPAGGSRAAGPPPP